MQATWESSSGRVRADAHLADQFGVPLPLKPHDGQPPRPGDRVRIWHLGTPVTGAESEVSLVVELT